MKSLLLFAALAIPLAAPAVAANIKVLAGTHTVIDVTGDIVAGDFQKFSAVAAKVAPGTLVWLASNGGKTFEAMNIGELIRERQFRTAVFSGEACVSSCALMWLAGTTRYIHPQGAVGFHAAYDSRTGRESGFGNAIVGAYMTHLGYGYKTVGWATSAPPTGALWVKADNTRLHGIDWQSIGK